MKSPDARIPALLLLKGLGSMVYLRWSLWYVTIRTLVQIFSSSTFCSVTTVKHHQLSFKMHSSVLSALSLLAAPLLAAAEAQPYLRRAMGADEIFGLSKRQTSGYEPGSTTCSGSGTCAEACGAGYETCGTDFCYLPASQVCCSATSGKQFPSQISRP